MIQPKLIITPKIKVGELLDAYPQLEEVLLKLSPAFEKLKNPILRRTVARIATLQQAAFVGGIRTYELVNRLRREVGQIEFTGKENDNPYLLSIPPDWFDVSKITYRFDASPIINAGGSPMPEILSAAHKLTHGELLELKTPFVPAPVIDILKEKGHNVFSIQKGDTVFSYIESAR